MKKAEIPPSIAAYKIEPELREGVVRHVYDTLATRTTRRIAWNLFLAAFCIAYFFASLLVAPLRLFGIGNDPAAITPCDHLKESCTLPGPMFSVPWAVVEMRDLWAICLVSGAALCLAGLLAMEARFASRRRLLRFGRPGVAVVCGRRNESRLFYFLTCELRFGDYGIYTSETRVTVEEYELYPEGSPITVLYPPNELYRAEPYVGIREARIEGAVRPEGQLIG